MKCGLYFCLIWALTLAPLASARPKSREWIDKNWARLDAAPELSLEENLNALQGVLRGIGDVPAARRTPEEAELFARVQELLTSTPGHAHYYRDRILEAKNRAFTHGQPKTEPEYAEYLRARMYALQTLSHLPSLETLEVLSGFLDDKDRPSGESSDLGYFNPLALAVIPTFNKLIEEQAKRDYGITWRKWRDAVRAGELTFRFKGSDVRYNFDGPVEPRQERAPKNRPPEGAPPSTSKETGNLAAGADPDDPRSPWPFVVAIICVVGSLLYLAVSRRKKVTG